MLKCDRSMVTWDCKPKIQCLIFGCLFFALFKVAECQLQTNPVIFVFDIPSYKWLWLFFILVLIIDAKRDTDSAEFKNKMTGLLTRLFVAANAKKGQSSSDVCVQVSAV